MLEKGPYLILSRWVNDDETAFGDWHATVVKTKEEVVAWVTKPRNYDQQVRVLQLDRCLFLPYLTVEVPVEIEFTEHYPEPEDLPLARDLKPIDLGHDPEEEPNAGAPEA